MLAGAMEHRTHGTPAEDRFRTGLRGESGGLRRLALGTRISEYRCSLPGLAGFSTYRREEPTETTIERRGKAGGARGIRTLDTGFSRIHTFQACSFNRSDIAPLEARRPLGGVRGRAL